MTSCYYYPHVPGTRNALYIESILRSKNFKSTVDGLDSSFASLLHTESALNLMFLFIYNAETFPSYVLWMLITRKGLRDTSPTV